MEKQYMVTDKRHLFSESKKADLKKETQAIMMCLKNGLITPEQAERDLAEAIENG